ncbi:IS66 Orf2 like protein [anaerobic digester metagenome]
MVQPRKPSSGSAGNESVKLGDITIAKEIYIACGYTDMRKSIDGLVALVQETMGLNPFSPALYLFCGKRRDRIKALLWEGDGFVLFCGTFYLSAYRY